MPMDDQKTDELYLDAKTVLTATHTTSTSDLQRTTFKPKVRALLKAAIKHTHQATKAEHHIQILKTALHENRIPRGLTPQIKHNIPAPSTELIIDWSEILEECGTKLTQRMIAHWEQQKVDSEAQLGKVEGLILEEGLTPSDPAYSNFHMILKEVEEAVKQEMKRRKPQRDRPIIQASKKRFMPQGTDVTPTQDII